ncbi:hypothetical protein ASU33_06300 [Solirubrum puertoriconensis]|uniref:Uncharacterized protein n=2 Tax=Solirubrum puertoriconensis TaxID=1751427 RepID=A0A9X0HJ97_SOLP1|nr:hypothetical protein ASU33_06300 [Solirubrum puertoriconensis]
MLGFASGFVGAVGVSAWGVAGTSARLGGAVGKVGCWGMGVGALPPGVGALGVVGLLGPVLGGGVLPPPGLVVGAGFPEVSSTLGRGVRGGRTGGVCEAGGGGMLPGVWAGGGVVGTGLLRTGGGVVGAGVFRTGGGVVLTGGGGVFRTGGGGVVRTGGGGVRTGPGGTLGGAEGGG